MKLTYGMGGWAAQGQPTTFNHSDHGEDWVIGGNHTVQAPGNGVCVNILQDAPFPNGFGPHYAIVRIDSGPFARHEWYLGHDTALVSVGGAFHFGDHLAVANQSAQAAGWPAGWIELGEAFGGAPGYVNPPHWYAGLLHQTVTVNVPDPPLHGPSHPGGHDFSIGPRVWLLTWRLHYIDSHARVGMGYSSNVVNWVKAFQYRHKLKRQDGVCDDATYLAVAHTAEVCKKNHKKEV